MSRPRKEQVSLIYTPYKSNWDIHCNKVNPLIFRMTVLVVFLVVSLYTIFTFLSLYGCTAPSQVSIDKGLKVLESQLKLAKESLNIEQFEKANNIAKTSLSSIKRCKYTRGVRDDTDLHLTLAEVEESRGNIKVAANLRVGVLNTRIKCHESNE